MIVPLFKRACQQASFVGLMIALTACSNGSVSTPETMKDTVRLEQCEGPKLCGMINGLGQYVISPEYENLFREEYGLIPMMKNGRVGLIDISGNIIVKPAYKYLDIIRPDLIIARGPDDRLGAINRKGEIIIPMIYSRLFFEDNGPGLFGRYSTGQYLTGHITRTGIETVHEGKLFFNFENGQGLLKIAKPGQNAGLYSATGDEIFPPKYRDFRRLSESRFGVKQNDLWGISDERGKLIVTPKYKRLNKTEHNMLSATHASGTDILDLNGNIILETGYRNISVEGADLDLFLVWGEGPRGGLMGVIRRDGTVIIPPEYFFIGLHKEGWLELQTLKSVSKNTSAIRKGFADLDGNIFLEPIYGSPGQKFHDGLAALSVKDGENFKHGFVNMKGEIVIDPIYRFAGGFSEGLAFVVLREDHPDYPASKGKTGYINTDGDLVIPPIFIAAMDFKNGFAHVKLDPGSQWRYIRKDGSGVGWSVKDEWIMPAPMSDYIDEAKTDRMVE